ncbi:putative zinc finger protein [Schistosoma mansoni]|uniref:putative zinc finger protein n=1 Tax=Schistosoma mansoni TaxID=6183 RepID=UPI00022DC69E|nr:putative zinc finger protein [Schistosoma mansoni]|eukprot:XP_018649112.1 putative zinc finger protein [Schistosoma mansoni]
MLMNINNFMESVIPKTSTPTKELTGTDYINESSGHDMIKTDLLNSYTGTLSSVASSRKLTTSKNISSHNSNRSILKDSETAASAECLSKDESYHKSNNSPTNYNGTEFLQGYTLINNQENLEANGLKMRLLATLADMIPHDESLSLRLLMSYTIDDQESECVVIDETLCRGGKRNETNNNSFQNYLDKPISSNGIHETLLNEKKPILSAISLESSTTQQSTSNEADALDLSLHNETSDSMDYHTGSLNTKSTKQDYKSQGIIDGVISETKSSINTGCIPLSLLSSSPVQSNMNTTKALDKIVTTTSAANSINQIPLFDTSILALLPLLQQQQQSQQIQSNQQGTNTLTFQNVLNPSSLSLLPATVPTSMTTISTTKSNPVTYNYTGMSTNANLLFSQLYPTQLQQNIQQTNNLITTHLSAIIPKQTETTTTEPASTSVSNTIVGSLTNNAVNTQSLLNTASVIGFPLINPFSLHTNITNNNSISNNNSNTDQFNAFLTSTPFLGTTSTSTLSQALPTQSSPSNITSISLGSTNTTATLLNVKDKQTGLIETVGIMPSIKHLNQPIASLINQLTLNASSTNNNNNNNNISLKTLSTLSQLFNSNLLTTISTPNSINHNITSSNTNSTNFNIVNNLNIPTIINTNINNNHTSLDNGTMNDNGLITIEKTHTKSSSSANKLSNSSSPLYSLNNHSTDKLSKLTSAKYHKNENMKLSGQQSNTTTTTTTTTNATTANSNFLFGRRLVLSRRFICNQCRRNFSSLAELNRHTIEAHNSFRCTICSAHFTQRSNLQRHSLKHVGFKPFTCNLCKKEYYRKDHLVRHIEVTHPTHDPKMNITVHLTSSECLDYLDRLQAGKQSQSPLLHHNQAENKESTSSFSSDVTTNITTTATTISTGSSIKNSTASDICNKNSIYKEDFDLMNEESMRIEEATLETPDIEMNGDNDINNNEEDIEEQYYNMTDCNEIS